MKVRYSILPTVIVFVLLLAAPAQAVTGPSNYWECVIDRMVEAKSDRDATTIRKRCRWDFPDFYWRRATQRSNGGFLGLFTKDQGKCLDDNLKETKSRVAKEEIRQACRALYRP